MQEEYIQSLLEKHKASTITDAEKSVLDAWYLQVAVDSSNTISDEERLKTFDAILLNLQESIKSRAT